MFHPFKMSTEVSLFIFLQRYLFIVLSQKNVNIIRKRGLEFRVDWCFFPCILTLFVFLCGVFEELSGEYQFAGIGRLVQCYHLKSQLHIDLLAFGIRLLYSFTVAMCCATSSSFSPFLTPSLSIRKISLLFV